jgi:hypothetical protein
LVKDVRWKKYFSQLFNVHRASGAGHVEIPTAEQLLHDPSPFAVEIANVKLKYKAPGSDEVSTN